MYTYTSEHHNDPNLLLDMKGEQYEEDQKEARDAKQRTMEQQAEILQSRVNDALADVDSAAHAISESEIPKKAEHHVRKWAGNTKFVGKKGHMTYDEWNEYMYNLKRERHLKTKFRKKEILRRIEEDTEIDIGYDVDDESEKYVSPFEVEVPDVNDKAQEFTYAQVKEIINDPSYDPGSLFVNSHMQFVENYVNGKYNWALPDLTINQALLPDNFIATKSYANMFDSILRKYNDDDVMRQRLARVHDMANAPDSNEYMKRYHSADATPTEIAQNQVGTSELYSDWSQPYEHRMNVVKFQHHIAKQINFGYDAGETV